jgi:DNA-binding NarL/FixJ family response regulator
VSSAIRVLVVDDHALFREGIRQVLTPELGFEVVGEAARGTEVVPQVLRHAPNVVLLDISLPGLSGLEVAAALRALPAAPGVLMLSVHDHAEYVLQSVRAGAQGYLRKDTSPTELRAAVRAVAEGETFFSPAVAGRLAELARDPVPADRHREKLEQLTPREREVLVGIVNGDTNKEIAGRLGISPRTVETHRESIMRKLEIRSDAGLTRFAVDRGIIATDPPSGR